MKNLIYFIFLVGFLGNSQTRDVDGVRFILTGNNLQINTDNYNVVNADFVSILTVDNLYRPLWRVDQLEEFIFQDRFDTSLVGLATNNVDFTQRDAYGVGPDRLIRGVKTLQTWYFHSGTDNPDYGYTLGVTEDDDTGGRHDTSLEDVKRRARDLATRTGQEIGVYRFNRLTYDALDLSVGNGINVSGLDRITIHLPYYLVERY